MLKIINRYKKKIILGSFAYIYIVMMLIAPSGYGAITPGAIMTTKNVYEIENVDFINDINTVSVYSWHELSTFQKWLTAYDKKIAISKVASSQKDDQTQGKISYQSSHDNALIAAYEFANIKDSNIQINYDLTGFTIYATNAKDFAIGDVIKKINNISISGTSYENYLTDLDILDPTNSRYLRGHNLEIVVSRENKELTLNLSAEQAIYFFPKFDIKKTTPEYSKLNLPLFVGGSSGGMIQTLSIYSALLGIEYSNVKIAGTGTIEIDDLRTIGKIGGIVQKFYTIKKAKVDVFIIPSAHYDEISELVAAQNKVNVIKVDTFLDVIKGLETYEKK